MKLNKIIPTPVDAVMLIRDVLISLVNEETKMEKIRTYHEVKHAKVEILLETLRSERNIFDKFIGDSFNKKKYIYSGLLPIVDDALSKNDIELLKWALNKIVFVATDDPLYNYTEFKSKINESNNQFII